MENYPHALQNSNDQHLKTDLSNLKKWVKEELFKGCKFLTLGKKSLDNKGQIYEHFRNECFENLVGVKNLQGATVEQKETYLHLVWSQAVKDNLISTGLALRRSGIYTVMLNKFKGNRKS
jgi:hypothetical protein